jgi:hypothetical protein
LQQILQPVFLFVKCMLIYVAFMFTGSQDGPVGTAMGYELDGRGSIFLFSTAPSQALEPTPSLLSNGYLGLSQRVKRQGREADYLTPSSAEVMNGGAVPPLPHLSSWRGV